MRTFVYPALLSILITGLFVPGESRAQSEMDRRNTEVVQSVYLRTLSVAPSDDLVREAQNALDLAERSYGATASRTADMAVVLGRALNGTGQFEAAVSVLESALSVYDETMSDTRLRTAIARYELGRAQTGVGDSESAVSTLTEAYTVIEPLFRNLAADTGFMHEALRAAGGESAVNAAAQRVRNATSSVASQQPKAIVRIPPIYPPDVATNKGWVLLDFRLWPDGAVRDVVVLAADPPTVFDISAAMALSFWQFEPNGNSSTHHQLSIAFNARE